MSHKCFLFCLLCCIIGGLGQRIGNPDDTSKIERPCPSYDKDCIREFFAKHAYCKKRYRQVPDPLIRPQSVSYLPRVNLTINNLDLFITGLNGRIEEFYINRDTNNLVIAVEFRNLVQNTNITYLIFHRRAKEPVVTLGPASVTLPSLIITAVIPQIDNLQLERAECTTFANDLVPPTFLGPSAAESTDPQVQQTIVEVLADLALNTQEIYLTDSAFLIVTFIQHTICDFGLRLSK